MRVKSKIKDQKPNIWLGVFGSKTKNQRPRIGFGDALAYLIKSVLSGLQEVGGFQLLKTSGGGNRNMVPLRSFYFEVTLGS